VKGAAMFECRAVGLDFFDSAPSRAVNESELNCSPERLFEIFEDPDSWPIWVGSIEKVEWTSPEPIVAGTTRTVTLTNGITVDESFGIWDQGKRMSFCVVGVSRRVFSALAEDYQVTDLGSGRCKLHWTMAIDPPGIYRPIMPIVTLIMRWQTARVMKGLATYVDAERLK